jgi:hypothetical protein
VPFTQVHWSPAEMAYLGMVIAGFIAFAVTLASVSTWAKGADRAAPRRAVTPAARPDDNEHRRAA